MLRSFNSYRATLFWFIRDAVLRQWKFGLLILATGMASTAAKVGAVTVILTFATHAANNTPIEFLDYSLDPRGSRSPLIIASIVSALFYLISAGFMYIERRATYASWGVHAEFCAKRALNALGDPEYDRSSCVSTATPNAFQRLVNGHANTTGRVLSIAMGVFSPLVTFLFASVVLFVLSASITAVLGGALLLILPAHVWVNARAAKASEASSVHAGAHGQELRDFAAPLFSGKENVPCGTRHPELVNQLFAQGPVRRYRDLYIRRFRCFAESELLIGMTAAVAILVLVIGLGSWSLSHEDGWGTLLAYLVTLQFAFGSIGALTKRAASMNRFYPEVATYFAFDCARRGVRVPMRDGGDQVTESTADEDILLDD